MISTIHEEQDQRCDTCKHEKEPWVNGCSDCFDYELWEPKDEEVLRRSIDNDNKNNSMHHFPSSGGKTGS